MHLLETTVVCCKSRSPVRRTLCDEEINVISRGIENEVRGLKHVQLKVSMDNNVYVLYPHRRLKAAGVGSERYSVGGV